MYNLTKDQLLADLHTAYNDARRHKRGKCYQLEFEAFAESNLTELCDELFNRTYRPCPSTCFLISDPKLREVFAADFRDRIVHHLYFNYVHEMLERTFIPDSYSCIKKRGTLYGIKRMESHIRKESQNYQERCWVLKMDIRGYFMSISRQRLLDITLQSIDRMKEHYVDKVSDRRWQDVVDVDFVKYLSREIIMLDPTVDCNIKGRPSDWHSLPPSKSLFHSPEGCGLPIGNLTSQLFSNVYMNVFDQWMKREMKCRHYGRYVDDFYVVSCDREWLRGLIPQIRDFLCEELGLAVHEGKTIIRNVNYGIEFLGAFLKPHRRYVSHTTLRRVGRKIAALRRTLPFPDVEHLRCSLSSILGLMRQHRSWNLRRMLACTSLAPFKQYGSFDDGRARFIPSVAPVLP